MIPFTGKYIRSILKPYINQINLDCGAIVKPIVIANTSNYMCTVICFLHSAIPGHNPNVHTQEAASIRMNQVLVSYPIFFDQFLRSAYDVVTYISMEDLM